MVRAIFIFKVKVLNPMADEAFWLLKAMVDALSYLSNVIVVVVGCVCTGFSKVEVLLYCWGLAFHGDEQQVSK